MATLDEVISQMSEEDYFSDPIQFIIDSDLRIISVPDRGVVAGVVGDKNVNRINFQMPRYYNGFDMSKFKTRINYVNANGNPNYYTVTDSIIKDDLLIFSWLVDADVVAYAGTVAFSVNMVFADENGVTKQAFNTSDAGRLKVLEGIQVDKYIDYEEQVDLLSKLEADLTKYISSGINQIQDEGAKVKKSLPADYVKMTEDVTSLKGDLDKLRENTGLSTEAENLLISILRNSVYSTDQSANITALENAFASSGDDSGDPGDTGTETATYTITNNLTNVSNSNAAASVKKNASYSATLTAVDGYELNSVTVTMGGVDVTSTVYADGVVTIGAVTGNVVITATAVVSSETTGEEVALTKIYYNWDSNTEYSDGGNTEYSGVTPKFSASAWKSDVFDSDTVVNISILYGMSNANLRQYAGCISPDGGDVYYMEEIGHASTSEYTAQYTVRAGYCLIIINYNGGTPNAISVTK